jgi:hypothetical protein
VLYHFNENGLEAVCSNRHMLVLGFKSKILLFDLYAKHQMTIAPPNELSFFDRIECLNNGKVAVESSGNIFYLNTNSKYQWSDLGPGKLQGLTSLIDDRLVLKRGGLMDELHFSPKIYLQGAASPQAQLLVHSVQPKRAKDFTYLFNVTKAEGTTGLNRLGQVAISDLFGSQDPLSLEEAGLVKGLFKNIGVSSNLRGKVQVLPRLRKGDLAKVSGEVVLNMGELLFAKQYTEGSTIISVYKLLLKTNRRFELRGVCTSFAFVRNSFDGVAISCLCQSNFETTLNILTYGAQMRTRHVRLEAQFSEASVYHYSDKEYLLGLVDKRASRVKFFNLTLTDSSETLTKVNLLINSTF